MRRAVAMAIGLVLLAGGCSDAAPRPSDAQGAAPRDVVACFVDALDRHDRDAAEALMTPAQARIAETQTDSWLTNVISISNLEIDDPLPDARPGYAQAIHVPVEFDLEQTEALSMPNGHTLWGYVLVRNSDDEPWLIDDQGFA
jgi:hypothetical protein